MSGAKSPANVSSETSSPSAVVTTKQNATRTLTEIFDEMDSIALPVQQLFAEGEGPSTLRKTVMIMEAMDRLRGLVTPGVIAKMRSLQNSEIGFLTDNPKGYDDATLRDVFITALCRGFMPIGNEFNIISGRFYAAKNGLKKRVKNFPGLTNLAIKLAVPERDSQPGRALVSASAVWRMNGVMESIALSGEWRISVRVNQGMGDDAILGKAERKLYARILERITGAEWEDEPESLETASNCDSRPDPVVVTGPSKLPVGEVLAGIPEETDEPDERPGWWLDFQRQLNSTMDPKAATYVRDMFLKRCDNKAQEDLVREEANVHLSMLEDAAAENLF